MNPIFISYQQSDLVGKMIFLLLFASSIVTWTLFLKKFLEIRNLMKEGRLVKNAFSKKMINPMQCERKEGTSGFASLFLTVQQSSLRQFQKNTLINEEKERSLLVEKDLELIEADVMIAAAGEIKKVENSLFILSTIVALAPFLGLLGTVWGILTTFLDLQTNSNLRAESAMMGGLAMALATTVVGLIVAIPALLSYNYLRAQVSLVRHDLVTFGHTLLTHLRHFYGKE